MTMSYGGKRLQMHALQLTCVVVGDRGIATTAQRYCVPSQYSLSPMHLLIECKYLFVRIDSLGSSCVQVHIIAQVPYRLSQHELDLIKSWRKQTKGSERIKCRRDHHLSRGQKVTDQKRQKMIGFVQFILLCGRIATRVYFKRHIQIKLIRQNRSIV